MDVEEIKAAMLALSEEERWRIHSALNDSLNYYPIVTISGYDIAEDMRAEGFEHERLDEWANAAAYRVYNKHDGSADLHSAAVEWGRDLVIEWAKEDGVTLEPKEEEAA
jgi:hypothetical protein